MRFGAMSSNLRQYSDADCRKIEPSQTVDGRRSATLSSFDHTGLDGESQIRNAATESATSAQRFIAKGGRPEIPACPESHAEWQQLLRVLNHEINNSLTPIRTIAHTLGRLASDVKFENSVGTDFRHGLQIIRERTEALSRFLESYTRLATLAVPLRRKVAIDNLIARVVGLESRLAVRMIPGSKVSIYVDSDQLEQALINLVKNACDAVLLVTEEPSPTAVTVSWNVRGKDIVICIQDEGIGLAKPGCIFSPPYTTKSTGSGIGLFVARQVIVAHCGSLDIRNRSDRRGCRVEIKLPACVW